MKIKLLVLTILLGSQGFLFGMGGPGATREKIAVIQRQVPTLLEQSLRAVEKNLEQKLASGDLNVSSLVNYIEHKVPSNLWVPLTSRIALRSANLTVSEKLHFLGAMAFSAFIDPRDMNVLNNLRYTLASGIFPMNYKGDLTDKYFKITLTDRRIDDSFLVGNLLFLALARNDLILLKLLLDAGADINALTKVPKGPLTNEEFSEALEAGLSPLVFAVIKSRLDGIRLIIESGAALNQENLTQALASAIINKNIPIMNLLIKAGADIDSIYSHFNSVYTPLIHAVLINNKGIVQFLIKAGADINKKIKSSFRGREVVETALDWAIETGNEEIINILRQNGAKKASELEQQGK